MTPIEGTVDNGRRATIEFPFYTGPAGIEGEGERVVAVFFAGRLRDVGNGTEGTIDGERYVAESVEPSPVKAATRVRMRRA